MAKDVLNQVPCSAQLEAPDHKHKALSTGQMVAVAEFIKQVGGVDNARQALAALVKLKEAA